MGQDDSPSNRKRKNPYIAGVAALNFKPEQDWEIEEARTLHEQASFPFDVDRIIYEDCIQGMQELPAESIDLVIADPPFGIAFDGKGSQYNRKTELVVEGYQEVQSNYDDFTMAWISELPRIMKDTASAYIFSGWTNLKDVLLAVDAAHLTVINHIIWKYQFGVFTHRKYVTSHYHVLFLAKNQDSYFFNKVEHYPLDIWDIPRVYRPGQKKNGTKLPENVIFRCIDFSSKPGDLVLDPFMGNGTTATCAKAKFRHFLGFEINEKMRDILESNLQVVILGECYAPYRTMIPPAEELAKKYSAVKRILEDKQDE
ncbi:MAG TPA: site-specific DNA-methyltransferase [Candidatus Lokiarchaeia archaeon]|nr:site-specific DNA-methyltransferase [Candidatus Lokiarchaeia archaeon]